MVNIDGHDEEGGEAHIDVGGEHEDEGKKGTGEEGQEVDEYTLYGDRKTAYALVDAGLQLACLVA